MTARQHGRGSAQRTVLRNTLYLVASQALALPLTLLITVLAARWLGAAEFGHLYLASTYVATGFVFVEWGQGLALTGAIARDRQRVDELLAGGLALRLALAPVVIGCLVSMVWILGYDASFGLLLLLVALGACATSVSGALQDTLRALERADLSVRGAMGAQMLAALLVPAVLVGGASIRIYVLAQAACTVAGCAILWRILRGQGIAWHWPRLTTLRMLAQKGTPFLFFALVLVLQPSVDAFFLSRLAPEDVVGWNAVARKLLGVLTYPATALVAALYPTLSRLHAQEPQHYGATSSGVMRVAILVGVPAGLGCILFPELGVGFFGAASYAPACDNLRVLGIFLILLYASMPVSSVLMVAGRRTLWSGVQFLCVIASALLDPLLVPWFQVHYGNGGLGIGVANVVCEVAMLGIGMALLPRGTLQPWLVRTWALAVAGGLCMVMVAYVGRSASPWLAAPASIVTYLALMGWSGEIRQTRMFMRESRSA